MQERNELNVRVRLRHSWVTFLRFPLTPEQAERLAAGNGWSEIQARNPLEGLQFASVAARTTRRHPGPAPGHDDIP
jgi:hypothetical protein